MRKFAGIAAATAALLLAAPVSASAFDECYKPVSATGEKEDDRYEAMREAMKAWEKAAEKKYDEDFSWSYSGDRTVSCKWNKSGTEFWCTARAMPCKHDD